MTAQMGHLSKKNLKQYLAAHGLTSIQAPTVTGEVPNRSKKSVANRAKPKGQSLKSRRVRKQFSGQRN